MNGELTQLGIAGAILGLLAYVAKLVIPYLFRKLDQRDEEIKQLTADFRETVNHKQTEFTGAINRLADIQEKHINVVEAQTEVFSKILNK